MVDLSRQRGWYFPSRLWYIFLMLLFGCAHPISEDFRNQIDPSLTFSQIIKSPDEHSDNPVMLGGIIVQTHNFPDRTEIEVVQKELDWNGYPDRGDETLGRFIFVKNSFLEPEIYGKGRYVTGAGKIIGHKMGKVDNRDYKYPLIEVEQLKLWQTYSGAPYYDPYFYGPFYTYPLRRPFFMGYPYYYW